MFYPSAEMQSVYSSAPAYWSASYLYEGLLLELSINDNYKLLETI